MSLNLDELTGEEINLLDRGYEYVRAYLKNRGKAKRDKSDAEVLALGFSSAFLSCYRSMEEGYWEKKRAKKMSLEGMPVRAWETT